MKNSPCFPIRPTARLPRVLSRLTAAALFGVLAFACVAAQAASAENGKAAFIRNGCWQCHGFVGQGGVTGPALAPNPKPLSFITVFVRNTNGAMPPYQKAILSDADLADIFAYLQSIPKGKEYQSIPLLNP